VLLAWVLAGTLDITAAAIYYPLVSGVKVITLLQGIASGVLGDRAFGGGVDTAVLGLALHYLIALIWTVFFFLAACRFKVLVTHMFPTGIVYGVVVWAVMNLVVIPLSRVVPGPFDPIQAVIAAVILILCIGLPIVAIVGQLVRADVALGPGICGESGQTQ